MQFSGKGCISALVSVLLLCMGLAAVGQQAGPPSPPVGTPAAAAKPQAKSKMVPTEANPAATKPDKGAQPPSIVGDSVDATADMAGYVIGEQDVLAINVWREAELSSSVVVRPDGMITLPLVNDIYVIGMTTEALKTLLTEKLKPFVTVPQVTVSVREINSRKVYVMGQGAGREGPFRINSTTTVLQLIAEAGGLRDFAKRKKIYVMRTEHGKLKKYLFNYDEVIRGVRQEQDIVLQPGDTVVVP